MAIDVDAFKAGVLRQALNSVGAVGLRRQDKERGSSEGSWLLEDESRSSVFTSVCHASQRAQLWPRVKSFPFSLGYCDGRPSAQGQPSREKRWLLGMGANPSVCLVVPCLSAHREGQGLLSWSLHYCGGRTLCT